MSRRKNRSFQHYYRVSGSYEETFEEFVKARDRKVAVDRVERRLGERVSRVKVDVITREEYIENIG